MARMIVSEEKKSKPTTFSLRGKTLRRLERYFQIDEYDYGDRSRGVDTLMNDYFDSRKIK